MAWDPGCCTDPSQPQHPAFTLTHKQAHSAHLRLPDSHSPGLSHTPACRCSGRPPRGWGSCRWGRCQHENTGWVAVPGLSGVPQAAAAAVLPPAPSSAATCPQRGTGGAPGPTWCGLRQPETSPETRPGRGGAPRAFCSSGAADTCPAHPSRPPRCCWGCGCLHPASGALQAVRPQIKGAPSPGGAGRGAAQGPEPGFMSWARHPSGSELT